MTQWAKSGLQSSETNMFKSSNGVWTQQVSCGNFELGDTGDVVNWENALLERWDNHNDEPNCIRLSEKSLAAFSASLSKHRTAFTIVPGPHIHPSTSYYFNKYTSNVILITKDKSVPDNVAYFDFAEKRVDASSIAESVEQAKLRDDGYI